MCVKALFLGIHLSIKGPHSTLPPENEMGECPALHIATTILLRACMMESPYLMPHIHPTIQPFIPPSIHAYPRLLAKLHRAEAPLVRYMPEFELLEPAVARVSISENLSQRA